MIQLFSVSNPTELTADLRKIYEEAFPADERREWVQLTALLPNPHFMLNKVYFQEQLIGILNYWTLDRFCYIEHFAISEYERNKGFGYEVLKSLLLGVSSSVILEVEEPVTEMARNRIAFYERLNFRILDGEYYQPPYSTDKRRVKMLLMCYSGINDPIDFLIAKTHLYQSVYQIKE